MSETKLWKDGGFAADSWRHAEEDDGLGHVIVPLAAWLGLSEDQRKAASNRLGVLLAPGDKLDVIVPYLELLPLIALAFPAYTDGRSHSKAALLKSRYGYKGEIRAVGDVLTDQIPLLFRNGFDTLEVTNTVAQQRLTDGISSAVNVFCQPATTAAKKPAGYSWRRLPGAA
ncbi:MAG: DUF934 domain-containing protein [Rhizobiaceae bacterium]